VAQAAAPVAQGLIADKDLADQEQLAKATPAVAPITVTDQVVEVVEVAEQVQPELLFQTTQVVQPEQAALDYKLILTAVTYTGQVAEAGVSGQQPQLAQAV
jgi:hypothetical protein